ncbi:DUF6326 family protein [Devosia sp.]|uniref:DUF6326 family protein n=1 Tax=Devosia sp. TaxID=1871048 RepID=UPI003A9105C2
MSAQTQPSRTLENPPIPVQIKLAGAWTSFMFLYIYVDYLSLYKPGTVDDLLAGIVWEFEVSQTFVTTSMVLMAIPILMIVLSMALPARLNRATNLIVASLYIPFSIFNAVGESWLYFYGLAIGLEVMILGVILRTAWTWPRMPLPSNSAPVASDDRLRQQAVA